MKGLVPARSMASLSITIGGKVALKAQMLIDGYTCWWDTVEVPSSYVYVLGERGSKAISWLHDGRRAMNILGETGKCEQSSRKTLGRLENCSRFAFRWWCWAWSMLSSRATFCFNIQTTNQQRWIQPGVDWAPKTRWDKKKHRAQGCMQGSDHDWPWKAMSIKSKVGYDDQERWNTHCLHGLEILAVTEALGKLVPELEMAGR